MKRVRLPGLLASLSLCLALLRVFTVSQAQSQPVFRIGVLDNERGPISRGARLAVSQINSAGGVIGADGISYRLELIIQPTPEGDDLADAINLIAQAGVIAVLGPETSEDVLINLPLLQSLGVPVLTPAIGDTVIASDSQGVLFRTRAAELFQGGALADYLVNQLGVQNLVSIQLDRNSTASRVGFSLAYQQITGRTEGTLLLEDPLDLVPLVNEFISTSPQVAVTFGPPDLASQFYIQLRDAGWVGVFAYNQAEDPLFRDAVPLSELPGILTTTTWPIASVDGFSDAFLNAFVRAFGQAPTPVDAASYDAIILLSAAISEPGDLTTDLARITGVRGVQGILNPGNLLHGETSDNVAVTQLNSLGGAEIQARYAGTIRLPDEEPEVVPGEPTPTATLEGVYVMIESSVQNVRTGPGLEYDVLGQLRQGEQARVIGATVDFAWVVIEFRGQQGWLATYLLEVTGDRSTIPVIAPPPTPTPRPATATPTASPVADVVIIAASPSNIILGNPTSINVTVQNIGSLPAGPFAIAATFPPDNYFTSFNFTGLGGATQQVITMPVLLNTTTGNYNVTIVADLNNQVNEGATGEANNDDFIFTYKIDRSLILINNTTLNVSTTIDLEGNLTPQPDLTYTGAGLNTMAACSATANCIGLISPNLNWDTSYYDAITAANGVNTTFVANAQLVPGATVGILTAEGRRGVIRIDSINPGVSVTFTYRVYQSP